ncbi:MAG: relaxase/mobilization nuclease domain-containing protein [Streptococcus suis]
MATVNYIPYKKQSAFTMRGVMMYVSQKEKTLLKDQNYQLITGVNCCAETAFSEFTATKARYKKNDQTQFYHYTQSFKVGLDISPKQAHEIALEFAQKNYPDFEVLVATHTDAPHLHSHIIINSVSFEHGKKLHQPPNTLRTLRQSSDEICMAHGFEVLPTYSFGRSKTPSRAQRRAQERGNSWKDNLQQTIEIAMCVSKTKEDFIFNMERRGYFVKWTDTRKSITYTCPNGMDCRDYRLFGDKYLKANMELEFDYREQKKEIESETGWEYERGQLQNSTQKQTSQEIYTPRTTGRKLTDEILHNLKFLEKGVNEDDELETITHLATLTTLSFVGVYILLDALSRSNHSEIDDEILENYIDELKQEPENCIDYEEEQEQGFTMTMM